MNYTIEITRFEQKTEKYISSIEKIDAKNYLVEQHFTTFINDNDVNVASFPNDTIVSIRIEKK